MFFDSRVFTNILIAIILIISLSKVDDIKFYAILICFSIIAAYIIFKVLTTWNPIVRKILGSPVDEITKKQYAETVEAFVKYYRETKHMTDEEILNMYNDKDLTIHLRKEDVEKYIMDNKNKE